MLKAENRLRSDADFKKVKNEGTITQSEDFALATLDRDDAKPTRFGFVVSTKISKSAVARNGIKRALRSSVAGLITRVKAGQDVVFLVKVVIMKKKIGEVAHEVERVMQSAKLLT